MKDLSYMLSMTINTYLIDKLKIYGLCYIYSKNSMLDK